MHTHKHRHSYFPAAPEIPDRAEFVQRLLTRNVDNYIVGRHGDGCNCDDDDY
jgi:hypothetical protein